MKKILFAMLALLILMFGCISNEYSHYQERDGSALVVQKFDMSGVLGSLEEEQIESTLQQMCANSTAKDPELKCEYDVKGIVYFEKTFTPGDGHYIFETGGDILNKKYTLTVKSAPRMDTSTEESMGEAEVLGEETEIKLTGSEAKAMAANYKQFGMNLTYTVYMPGKIISANGGIISEDGTSAKFDMLDMMEDGKEIVVVSEEMDMMVVGGIVILLIVILAYFLFLKK
ncbi:hypothetical protein JXB01_03490 [Candidatus Micrarchaeota archaeon]|nr:hypothetical protein [Candidatus Micrarchaeota archaeon]